MTIKELPSAEILRKLLRYEPETGKLFWRERPQEFCKSVRECGRWNTRFANREAFTSKTKKGYHHGDIFAVKCRAHRVIWAMQTGAWPVNQIDHIDRDKSNNRWVNLREATPSQNSANVSSAKNSSSKFLGVNWQKASKKWIARISQNRKRIFLGLFNCEIEAARAYNAAALKIHGNFANLNCV